MREAAVAMSRIGTDRKDRSGYHAAKISFSFASRLSVPCVPEGVAAGFRADSS
jgi:hypothetical protein